MTPKKVLFSCLTLVLAAPAFAFNSGSTGADGAFTPILDPKSPVIEKELPPDGIFNFTEVNIPAGLTVKFKRNAANTPVYILASGDINIAGKIDVSGSVNDGQTPGAGGPGGFDGGLGGRLLSPGGSGKGPGGGAGGLYTGKDCNGGSGVYGAAGSSGICYGGVSNPSYTSVGTVYGSPGLVPLLGGSGGGGCGGLVDRTCNGGGGGGGALLMAATGKISITGGVFADGGRANGRVWYLSNLTYGGGGSGGAIRLIASIIDGSGAISAVGGATESNQWGIGGAGRIRLEAEVLNRTVQSTPYFTTYVPLEALPATLPMLRFVSIAGAAAPTVPTGDSDVSLPADVGNPVTVELASSGVPLGSTIKLLSSPEIGAQATATSTPISGSESAGTATAQINIADGKSTMIATVGFTVTAALGKELAPYANGETVARVELSTGLQGGGETKLITASGKEYLLPPTAKAVLAQ